MGGSDGAKLFVGGLSQDITREGLKSHFSPLGALTDAVVMYDSASGRSRGFGFVTFEKAEAIDAILATPQIIDGKEVDCKLACPREVMAARQMGGHYYHGAQPSIKTNRIFVGGLPDLTTAEFKMYFSNYGKVMDAVLMTDKSSNRPRGFGFVTYESSDTVDEVAKKYRDHQIKDKWIEVKKAQSKERLVQSREGSAGRGSFPPFAGGYGAGAFGGYYDGYRGGYPDFDYRRAAYGGALGYDPYAVHSTAYGAYGDAGGRRPYSPYGSTRQPAAGYRGAAVPADRYRMPGGAGRGYAGPSAAAGGYGGQLGGGPSAYAATAYEGGFWSAGV